MQMAFKADPKLRQEYDARHLTVQKYFEERFEQSSQRTIASEALRKRVVDYRAAHPKGCSYEEALAAVSKQAGVLANQYRDVA
jgi:hypothetical protein